MFEVFSPTTRHNNKTSSKERINNGHNITQEANFKNVRLTKITLLIRNYIKNCD